MKLIEVAGASTGICLAFAYFVRRLVKIHLVEPLSGGKTSETALPSSNENDSRYNWSGSDEIKAALLLLPETENTKLSSDQSDAIPLNKTSFDESISVIVTPPTIEPLLIRTTHDNFPRPDSKPISQAAFRSSAVTNRELPMPWPECPKAAVPSRGDDASVEGSEGSRANSRSSSRTRSSRVPGIR